MEGHFQQDLFPAAKPSGDAWFAIKMPLIEVQPSNRSGASVEVLVTAPGGKIRSNVMQVQRHIADCVGQVETDLRARGTPRVAGRLLLVHGERDATVPVEHAHRLAAASNGKAELWLMPERGHSDPHLEPGFGDRVVLLFQEQLAAQTQ